MKLDLLAIGAHPDDVELGCAGLLLAEKSTGKKTGIIDLTRGELGTRGTKESRLQEAGEASKILQLDARENLEMADGFFQNDEKHQRKLIAAIRKYRPEIIIATAPEDRHPDHGRSAQLIKDAAFLSGLKKIETTENGKEQEAWRPKYVFHFIQDRYLQPNFVYDITPYFLKKIEAIRAFKTQFFDEGSHEPETYISKPGFLESIEHRARIFGKMIGVEYAEGFISEKTIGISSLNVLTQKNNLGMKTSPTPKFRNKKNSNFHQELKKRVQEYFDTNNKKPTGNYSLYFKAGLFWVIYIALYVHVVFYTPAAWIAILECLVMGCATAAIGFNVMHDGSHGSFSSSKILNKIAASSVNALGASVIMWNNKHNIIHHTYTNIGGVDDDIEIQPLIRLCPSQKRYFFHRYQHIYVWLLYTQLYIVWVFATDFVKYFRKKVGPVAIKKMSTWEHISFWVAKLFFYFTMIALPIYMVGFLSWLIGFLILAMSAGFILSTVFQLAHTVEHTSFPEPIMPENDIENEWAMHQIATTANFATKNKLISWLVGGLNFQVEHHLFPKISHVHYPAISKIVKKTCDDFNVKYIEFKHMRDAIISHTLHLKKLGTV